MIMGARLMLVVVARTSEARSEVERAWSRLSGRIPSSISPASADVRQLVQRHGLARA